MFKILFTSVVMLIGGLAIHFYGTIFGGGEQQNGANLENFIKDGWFGKQVPDGKTLPKDWLDIRPFQVNISDSDLHDLQQRLKIARYADHIEGTQFTYGFNSRYLKQVVQHWRFKFDWRREEAKLNSHPQFVTQIEGIDIHFVRVKPSKAAKKVIPLLVIHGWPGSFFEYYKSIPLLTEPDKGGLAFEVIAPSIPGFGYSEAPHQKGFNIAAAARVFVKLMQRLGHEKFLAHGGDFGSGISRFIGAVYSQNTFGIHILGNWDLTSATNSLAQMVKVFMAANFPSLYFGLEHAEKEYAKSFPLSKKIAFLLHESGYMHIQSTKPDTVAAGLVDSPVGLAAYILEKYSTWTNAEYVYREDGGLTQKFTLDELLTNVMIYWTSGNIAASQRFYKENIPELDKYSSLRVMVPAATVDMPHELLRTPRKLVEHFSYESLVQYSEFPRGGHFTALEEPQLVCDDIRQFVHKLIEA